GDLRVKGSHGSSRPVAVKDHVMGSHNPVVGLHFSADSGSQLRISRLADQGFQGVPGNADTRPHHHQGDENSHYRIDVPSQETVYQNGQDRHTGGHHVPQRIRS